METTETINTRPTQASERGHSIHEGFTKRPGMPVPTGQDLGLLSPLEVAGDCDLAVHQCLHDPTDHLIQGPRHVLGEPPLKALLHLFPTKRGDEVTSAAAF